MPGWCHWHFEQIPVCSRCQPRAHIFLLFAVAARAAVPKRPDSGAAAVQVSAGLNDLILSWAPPNQGTELAATNFSWSCRRSSKSSLQDRCLSVPCGNPNLAHSRPSS
jgi:hypothetical protein